MKNGKVRDIVKGVRHGEYFPELATLQKAINSNIESSGINDVSLFDNERKTKEGLKAVRYQIIDSILDLFQEQSRLTYGRKMPADHYARCFHALAILKVDKKDVEVIADDQLHCAFWQLWLRDDGTDGFWKTIDTVSFSISEAMKRLKGNRK